MAVLTIPLWTLLLVAVCGRIPRNESGQFPLEGCSTDQMDLLFLYFDTSFDPFNKNQYKIADTFARDIVSSDKTTARVKFAGVYDSFSSGNLFINVSSWHFTDLNTFLNYSNYTHDDHHGKAMYYNDVNETVNLKIQFLQRLFSEMGGVRKNVTHVAIIFIDGEFLTFEDARGIPYIVQQQLSDIKIFVLVFVSKQQNYVVYLLDTLLIRNGYMDISKTSSHLLKMAVCNTCLSPFVIHQHNGHTDYLSCYVLFWYRNKVSWNIAMNECSEFGSSLGTIESKEELVFLENEFSRHSFYSVFDSPSPHLSTHVFIGLRRDTSDLVKRFRWSPYGDEKTRPLAINHWLLEKPSGGFSQECGAWIFFWNDTDRNETPMTYDGTSVVDGWSDVGCDDVRGSHSLCEVVLPRRVESKNMMAIKEATTERFDSALKKGNLMTFKGNIISVSANIGQDDFQTYMKQKESELFPLFDCGMGVPGPRYISYIYVCDSVDHCNNRQDEIFCSAREQNTTKNEEGFGKKCSGVYCCDDSCLPLQWVNDREVDCDVCGYSGESGVNDESEVLNKYLKRNETCAFFCNDDQCVHFSQLNDGHTDCAGPDGPIDETIGKLEQADTCYNILGHIIWAPRCVYVRDRYGAVLGCRDMSHLDNCSDFECPEGYFKCPNTYCIPQHYVLDREIDCPSGDEENNYIIGPCTGNFACWDSTMCLHPDLVCDGHPDCPHQDDEVDCNVTCIEGLRCISGTITLPQYKTSNTSIDLTNAFYYEDSRYLDLSLMNLSSSDLSFLQQLPKLVVIVLSHCSIDSDNIKFYVFPHSLQTLDISYNQLWVIDGWKSHGSPSQHLRHFNLSHNTELVDVRNVQLQFLELLDLSHTSVSFVGTSFFVWFPSLKHLNLSFTKSININKNSFPPNRIFHSLDLRGLAIIHFYEDFFNGLTVDQDLYTDSFELCCPQIRGANIPDSLCHSPDNSISSCLDLIAVDFQRILLWMVAVLAVLGNMTVIGYRVIWDRSVIRTGYGLFVSNLGISDFIMGVYLFIIAGADYYYRDIYILYDKRWRESVVCKLAGFLATLSCETSTFFVFLITLDRFLVMKFPFGQVKFSKMSKIIVLSLSWIIGFLLALTPIVFRFEIYSSNAMCLGLPLTTKRLNGWEFTFAVFIVLNLCLVLIIGCGQRAIFRSMSENRISQLVSRREQDITVAKQLFLVAVSNFLCWFPVGILGLLSFGGHEINKDVYAWTTVIVLPINSAANPFLYTIPALLATWEQFKHGNIKNVQVDTQSTSR